jgi:hypothetical protein
MTNLLTTFNVRWAFAQRPAVGDLPPGGLDHWRSAFSFAFGNAGSSTRCRHVPCLHKHAGTAIHGSLAACRRSALEQLNILKSKDPCHEKSIVINIILLFKYYIIM